ncbi:hypothetical protein [Acinetobacter sp. HY1485]|uniref:hypothetical protein n=1 Tax=Acinetobacter sp. HY1485 TaxID=2970918 RepID=UPI0022B9B682|nr:hypothetical protein [Acinetobacter sp. HY1485]
MRLLACLLLGATLAGCGQSGALQLTNDPHLDTRPKYLLWHKNEQPAQPTSEQQ